MQLPFKWLDVPDSALPDSADRFLRNCAFGRKLSPNTVRAYYYDLRQFGRFLQGKFAGQQINKHTVAEFLADQHTRKARTVRRRIAALKAFSEFLQNNGLIETNPLSEHKIRVKLPPLRPRAVSVDVIKRVLLNVYDQAMTTNQPKMRRDLAILELLFSTGIRVTELSSLSLTDINLSEQTVRVVGKGGKERIIPLCGRELLTALNDYLKCRSAKTAQFFFTNRSGNRLSEQSVRQIVKKHAKGTEPNRLTPHVFRHTIATLLLEKGVDLRHIQRFLGHSSITTTTIYVHVAEAAHQAVLRANHPRVFLRVRSKG